LAMIAQTLHNLQKTRGSHITTTKPTLALLHSHWPRKTTQGNYPQHRQGKGHTLTTNTRQGVHTIAHTETHTHKHTKERKREEGRERERERERASKLQ
jgi:hypothetical protein